MSTPDSSSRKAVARFFVRIGQAGRAAEAHIDRYTIPLFPLPVIMDAEGLLAPDARHLARATDPETSRQAAGRARGLSARHRAAIFAWLKDHPEGGTKNEIDAWVGGRKLDPWQIARRMKELCKTAGVYDSGERRKTPTGRAATVWRIR